MRHTQNMNQGANYAAGLPALDNESLQVLLGTRLSQYVIAQFKRRLPAQLFINIDMDVDLCTTHSFICEDHSDLPHIQSSAINGGVKRKTLTPPKVKTFHGYHTGGFETKMAREQLTCINGNQILRDWYRNSLEQAIEDGKQSIMAWFYRYLMAYGVHPDNTGNNAGQVRKKWRIGSRTRPIRLTPDNIDVWYVNLLNVIGEMPRMTMVENEFGASKENAFLFGPPELESLLMKNERYNSWDKIGDCAACSAFTDVFDRNPRGIYHITSYCTDEYQCRSGNQTVSVFPILFGRRYSGVKASMRVENYSYDSLDKQSTFFRTQFYWNIFVYDCRNLGLSYVILDDVQPEVVTCGD